MTLGNNLQDQRRPRASRQPRRALPCRPWLIATNYWAGPPSWPPIFWTVCPTGPSGRRSTSPPFVRYWARDSYNWVPESSRRARGFAVYAALRSLGRSGLAEMIDRCCSLARRMADRLRGADGVTILNDVVLNQVLVRFEPPGGGDADAFTRDVIAAVQADGTCWLGGTTWHGMTAMRISVSNWSTTEADADMSVAAILRLSRAAAQAPSATIG